MSRDAIRRAEKAMSLDSVEVFLARARVISLATVDPDGMPYVVPNIFTYEPGLLRVHTTAARGHFRRNVEASPRIGFTVYECGEVYPYGRFECDTSVSYESVVGVGTVSIEEADGERSRFFDLLMAKYADPAWQRPSGFYPRLGGVTVYRIAVEAATGKTGALPGVTERWPAVDRTMSPGVVVPAK